MANYESRLERLEQQAGTKDEPWRNTALVFLHDSDERPYDRIEYQPKYGGEAQAITRVDGESLTELERRARNAWGLADNTLLRVHFVAGNRKHDPGFVDFNDGQ